MFDWLKKIQMFVYKNKKQKQQQLKQLVNKKWIKRKRILGKNNFGEKRKLVLILSTTFGKNRDIQQVFLKHQIFVKIEKKN